MEKIDTEIEKEVDPIQAKDKNQDLKDLEAKYPKVKVEFCSICTFPIEYCEISHPVLVKAKKLILRDAKNTEEIKVEEKKENDDNKLEENKEEKKEISIKEDQKDQVTNTTVVPDTTSQPDDDNQVKKKKKKEKEKKVIVEQVSRGKKKHTTYVCNLEKFNINLKDTSKLFSKKFACSANVTKEDDGQEVITLTGEFLYEIKDYLLEKFPTILKEDDISLVEKAK